MEPTPYRREPGYALRYRDVRFSTAHGERTDRRERAALRRLLRRWSGIGRTDGPWLDVPCGAGRLSGELPGDCVQVDRDPAMVSAIRAPGRRAVALASALPFQDRVFAGVLCCRLLQHVPGDVERRGILSELRRVTRGCVIVSFFDSRSLLSVRRRLRRALGKNRSGRSAITRSRFAADAAAAGLSVVAMVSLGRFVAEQTLALCRPGDRPQDRVTNASQ